MGIEPTARQKAERFADRFAAKGGNHSNDDNAGSQRLNGQERNERGFCVVFDRGCHL